MRFKILSFFLLSMSFVLFTGCKSTAVYNVKQAPIAMQNESYTLSDVEKAIIKAGGSKWQMQKTEPGHIVGTLNHGKLMAQVDITYNRQDYNIEYKNSQNLNYDGTNIHRRYNNWIQKLSQRIQSNLIRMGTDNQ